MKDWQCSYWSIIVTGNSNINNINSTVLFNIGYRVLVSVIVDHVYRAAAPALQRWRQRM